MEYNSNNKEKMTDHNISPVGFFIFFFFFFEIEGRHAGTKAQDAVAHMASFVSSREEISQSEIEPPTSSLTTSWI